MRILPAFLLVALVGCDPAQPSTDVNQARIFAEYELAYLGEEDLTRARTFFNFGGANGTQLRLEGGAEVSFEGETLDLVQSIANLLYYEDVEAGEERTGTFRYTDADGNTFENEATLRPLAFPDTVGPLDNDEAYTLTWGGAPVGEDEVVSVTLFRVGTETELAVFTERTEGATDILLTRDQLQNVQPGEVSLVLTRERNRAAEDAPSVGGSIKETYQPPFQRVTVED